jgi:dipeptidyl aminopeptidase/acylaminoacyl peptidase
MTKIVCLAYLLFFYSICTVAQKASLDKDAYESWTSISGTEINDNGTYVYYYIDNQPKGSSTLVITATDGKRHISFKGAHSATFTDEGKQLYFIQGQDTLTILNLENFNIYNIYNVNKYDLLGTKHNEWLIYEKSSTSELILSKFKSKKYYSYKEYDSYTISNNRKIILFKRKLDQKQTSKLKWFNIETSKMYDIWDGNNVLAQSISNDNHHCAFIIEGENMKKRDRKVYLYTEGEENDKMILDSNDIGSDVFISDTEMKFNSTSKDFFFILERIVTPIVAKKLKVNVDVWNYKDIYLQSEQLLNSSGIEERANLGAIYKTESKKLIKINLGKREDFNYTKNINNYILLIGQPGPQAFYKKEQWPYLLLINTKSNGERTMIINQSCSSFFCATMSPLEDFVVWFDNDQLTWFSYEISTKLIRDIGAAIPYSLYSEAGLDIGRKGTWGMAGWIPAEKSILIYDQYDIWKISLDGHKIPVNITNGWGRRFGITLNIVGRELESSSFELGEKVLIGGYDEKTKSGGYWQLKLGERTEFKNGNIQAYSISTRMPVGIYGSSSAIIKKAKNSNAYLLLRERAEESMNIFFTKDFIKFLKISDVHPEMKYNWLTTELITWKMLDGNISQGILYKPGNFDVNKRYPLIINYYEKRSGELHKYIKPEFSTHNINIPTFVDRGYLVFVPDIYSKPGHNGEGSYNAIESAAQYLSKFSFIDSLKIGLQGHSYGGWQTNYMITHSKRFAAACEASGVSDQVSSYGQLEYLKGGARQNFYETKSQGSPYGIGITPWTESALYINNSPIFRIGEIVTPLLMMHNKEDGAVPFEQAVELFVGMRRANKRVWLLQYDGYGHQVDGEVAEDYHIRMMQFFDYYLKKALPPIWMTKGIPAIYKGIVNGYEFDSTGVNP